MRKTLFKTLVRQLFLVSTMLWWVSSISNAQQPASSDTNQKPDTKKQNPDPQAEENKGEWVFAPIPVKSPAIGGGLEWAVGYVAPLNKDDKVSPPSLAGVAGLFTGNGSRGLAIGAKLYMKEDKYRISLPAAMRASTLIYTELEGPRERTKYSCL